MARTPEMMGAQRAAKFLGVHRDTLRTWHRHGEGPPRERKGKRYWYCREALKEWLKNGARAAPPTKPVVASALRVAGQGPATRSGAVVGAEMHLRMRHP